MNIGRALVKHITHMSSEQIIKFNLPTATPLIFEFDSSLNV